MKQIEFSTATINKTEAIVSIFETGEPSGSFAAIAVLNDGAGISYGIRQFTHRSGSLAAVVERYFANGGLIGRSILEDRMPLLRRTAKASIEILAGDALFKKALRNAALTRKMRDAQTRVAHDLYMRPALEECRRLELSLPLSLAVVYDSLIHGSFHKLSARLGPVVVEKKWITDYVKLRNRWLRSIKRLRPTTYRTEFFLREIAAGNWELRLPIDVHGRRLTEDILSSSQTFDFEKLSRPIPTNPPETPPDNLQKDRVQTGAVPSEAWRENGDLLDRIEARVNATGERIDQAERIVGTALAGSDKAKSLWVTVAGTAWQMAWAIGGIAGGLPREVWLVVAVTAGLLMLLFLYRQIVLGRLRETKRDA